MMLRYQIEILLGGAWFQCTEGGHCKLRDAAIGVQINVHLIIFYLACFNYHAHLIVNLIGNLIVI